MCDTQAHSAPASFTGLGFPFNIDSSRATAISPDGTAIVGGSSGPGYSVLWTAGNTFRLQETENRPLVESVPYDVTVVDGEAVVVGHVHLRPYRATTEHVSFDLEDVILDGDAAIARGISHDGIVVVGLSLYLGAYRWTEADGFLPLGSLTSEDRQSFATGVSADGSIVVGGSGGEAFRWDEISGMTGLGNLPGGTGSSFANDISGDGSVIIGQRSASLGSEAFRWTSDGGMVGLGDLDGGDFESTALGVSRDGAVIVGQGSTDSGLAAFLWTQDSGMRLLQDVLVDDYGLDLTGWTLFEATWVSADGRKIVGSGFNPDGIREGFVAVVPEPSTFALAILGITISGFMAYRQRPQ